MSPPVSQKRKSLPLEKKLEVYEFEVDENEPKTKQKKKRGPKPGTKNQVKWGNTKRGVVKSPIKSKVIHKVTKTKNLTVSLKTNKAQKEILSTKNSSSPLFENKRRPANIKSVKEAPIYSAEQKENLMEHNDQLSKLVDVCVDMKSISTRRSLREKKNPSTSVRDVVSLPESKKNLIECVSQNSNGEGVEMRSVSASRPNTEIKNFSATKERDRGTVLKSKKISSDQNIVSKPSRAVLKKSSSIVRQNHLENKPNQLGKHGSKVSKSLEMFDKENMPNSIEVPVMYHNHQDFSPEKTKTSFTPMSDDENINNSLEEKSQLENFFCPTSAGRHELSTSSFCHDAIRDHQVSVSTPVKYNRNDTCDSSIHDCFGFDEIELFEEPLVSPIKGENHSSTHQISTKSLTPKTPNKNNKEEVPVSQVIRLLKYGTEDDETSRKSSSNSVSPIFGDGSSEEENLRKLVKSDTPSRKVKPMPRRSYERPSYLRKKNDREEEEEDDSSEEEMPKKIIPKKKHPGPSKKETNEMQKWIEAFNSQCQEIDKFDLVVE